MDFKDIAIRAAKTFVQTFLAMIPLSVVKGAAVAAGAAAIAVVWNAALATWRK